MIVHGREAEGQAGVVGVSKDIEGFLTGMPQLGEKVCSWKEAVLEQHLCGVSGEKTNFLHHNCSFCRWGAARGSRRSCHKGFVFCQHGLGAAVLDELAVVDPQDIGAKTGDGLGIV